jgi:hypothetical protein
VQWAPVQLPDNSGLRLPIAVASPAKDLRVLMLVDRDERLRAYRSEDGRNFAAAVAIRLPSEMPEPRIVQPVARIATYTYVVLADADARTALTQWKWPSFSEWELGPEGSSKLIVATTAVATKGLAIDFIARITAARSVRARTSSPPTGREIVRSVTLLNERWSFACSRSRS